MIPKLGRYEMKHIVVDLEMNTVKKKTEARKICSYETIEIGAVMLGDDLQEISSFRTYVKPEYNEHIMPKITSLTGITDSMVAKAPKFSEAFRSFTEWCTSAGDGFIIYTWSDTDYKQIVKEMVLKEYNPSDAERPVTDVEWKDFQKEFDNYLGFEKQLSLSFALEMAGVEFSGRQHDALDDARNTAELLQSFKDKELFEITLKKIEEAMKPSESGICLGEMIDLSGLKLA